MRLWQVVFYGPFFAIQTHANAWRYGSRTQRRYMLVDGASNLAVPVLAIALQSHALAIMLAAQCATAFFAVWITHHG